MTAEYSGLLGQLAAGGLAQEGRAEVSVKPTAVGLGWPSTGRRPGPRTSPGSAPRPGRRGPRSPWTWRITPGWTRRGGSWPGAPRLTTRTWAGDPGPLRRSVADCAALTQPGSRVRLCKGAYDAPDAVATGPARRGPQLRPRAAGADGRARLPDGRHPRPAAGPHRRRPGGAGRPHARQLRVPDALRSPPGRAARWPRPGPGSGCTCPTARTGTATWSAGWPSGRRTRVLRPLAGVVPVRDSVFPVGARPARVGSRP